MGQFSSHGPFVTHSSPIIDDDTLPLLLIPIPDNIPPNIPIRTSSRSKQDPSYLKDYICLASHNIQSHPSHIASLISFALSLFHTQH